MSQVAENGVGAEAEAQAQDLRLRALHLLQVFAVCGRLGQNGWSKERTRKRLLDISKSCEHAVYSTGVYTAVLVTAFQNLWALPTYLPTFIHFGTLPDDATFLLDELLNPSPSILPAPAPPCAASAGRLLDGHSASDARTSALMNAL